MKKQKLIHGRKYLHHRKVIIDGRTMEAERWIRCLEVTDTGATFQHEFERIELTAQEIQTEIIQEADL